MCAQLRLCLLCFLQVVRGQLTVVWSYQSGSTAADRGYGMAVDPTTKDVVVAGSTEGTVHGDLKVGFRDWVAVKLDKDGALQWTYTMGELLSTSQVNGVAIDSAGNVVLAGVHKGSLLGVAIGGDDLAVVMLNNAGVQQWSFQQGSTAADSATCVAFDSSGNVIVGGWTRGTISGETFQGGTDDAVLLKLNSAGVQQWLMATELGTSGIDYIQALTTDASDNIFVTGAMGGAFDSNTFYGDRDAFILKTNSAGTFQWSYQTGTTAADIGMGIAINLGDVVAAGTTEGSLPGYANVGSATDGFIVKLNAAGLQQWLIQIGTSTDSSEMVNGLTVHPSSGNFAIYGYTGGDFNGDTNAGGNDWWAAEYDTSGALQWSYLHGTVSSGEQFFGGSYGVDGDLILAGDAPGSFYSNAHLGQTDFVAAKFSLPTSTSTTSGTSSTTLSSTTSSSLSSTSTTSGTSSTTLSSTTSSSLSSTSTASGTSSTTLSLTTTSSLSSTSTTSATSSTTLSSSLTTSSSTSGTTSASTTSTSRTTSTKSSTSTSSGTSTATTATSRTTTTSFTSTSTDTATTSTASSVTSTTSTRSTLSTSSSTATATTVTTSMRTSTSTVTVTVTSSSSTSPSTPTSGTLAVAPTVLFVSAAEAVSLEAERKQNAAAAVARVDAAEERAVAEAAPLLDNETEATLRTELGFINLASVTVKDLEAGTRIIHAEDAQGGVSPDFIEVAADTVAEVLASAGLNPDDPLLVSVVAVNEANRSIFETDAIVGEASVVSSTSVLSINFWGSDGTRIEVKGLANPIRFNLEVTDSDVKCAFWNEDTAKWSTDGTRTVSASGSIQCSTSHLTIFAGVKDVFLRNVVLALTCSTISSLLNESAFAELLNAAWLFSTPSILNIVFHGLGVVCVLLAWLYDCKTEHLVPREERDAVLMSVKEDEQEEDDLEDGDAPPPSRWTKCMGCCNHCLEYVSHASGGDATLEALKEVVGNADTAAVNRAISTIQSHKSGIARAQLSIFNQQRVNKMMGLQRQQTDTLDEFLHEAEDYGEAAAQAFLQRGWLCRIATLWPASHPWLKATHFSMLAPVKVSVALLFLKVTSAGALSAVFFSSGTPSPDSDPECFPPRDGVARAVQSFTVGLTTTILGDVIISILFTLQLKRVVYSPTQWTEKKKRRQHFRWNMWTFTFWLVFLLYGGCCQVYICLFLANVSDVDRTSWLQSMGVSLLEGFLLKSFLTAIVLATIATLVLCCRPHVLEKVHEKWLKDGNDVTESHEPQHEPSNETAESRASLKAQKDKLAVLPGAVMDA